MLKASANTCIFSFFILPPLYFNYFLNVYWNTVLYSWTKKICKLFYLHLFPFLLSFFMTQLLFFNSFNTYLQLLSLRFCNHPSKLSHNITISLSRHEQVCLIRVRFKRYFSHQEQEWIHINHVIRGRLKNSIKQLKSNIFESITPEELHLVANCTL